MQSHKEVIFNGAMISQLHRQGPDDVVVSALPCSRVYINVLMTGMMMFGTKLVLYKLFDPAISCRILPSTRR
jgi:long-chain acyl-CoA synthetase